MKVISLLGALVFMITAYAGDNGGGRLECSSDSGRTVLSGGAGAPYNGSGSAELEYLIDGQSIQFSSAVLASGAQVVDYVVYDHKKMYAVGFKRTTVHGPRVYASDIFQLRSIGGTFAQFRPDVFRFKAVIPAYSSLDPRLGHDLDKNEQVFDKDIHVNCVLDVSL